MYMSRKHMACMLFACIEYALSIGVATMGNKKALFVNGLCPLVLV
jgi:hypothetical protein